MAQTVLSVRFDWSPLRDALDELLAAHERLFSRHGEKFRGLQRDIEALTDVVPSLITEWIDLGEGEHVLAAPQRVSDLLRQARDLGV